MSIRTLTPSDREPTVSHAGTTAPQFHVHLSGRGNAGGVGEQTDGLEQVRGHHGDAHVQLERAVG
ncbi:hypothetical protein K1Y78_54555, partial [Streptomyces sp. tea 10]|nr:hypothetical protein [Streptomyces sp. tea 10]